MDFEEASLRFSSLLRHAGLSHVPRAALVGVLVLACLLVVVGVLHFQAKDGDEFSISSAETEKLDEQGPQTSQEAARTILVDVEGAVVSPGLYSLDENARVGDAVAAAGGLTADAVSAQVNLARKVADGEQVYVVSADELSASAAPAASNAASGAKGAEQGKVNINTATAEELQKLSGIGPSLAERIIDYRESSGRFSSVEDLQNVSGIGKTRFANIKDKICV